ncbi:MAG TPA: hypothetical protein VH682_04135 [Gemmataceae bacterium]
MRLKLRQYMRNIGSVAIGSCLGALGGGLYGVFFISLYALMGNGSAKASHLTLAWFAFSGAMAGGLVAVVRMIDRALG